MAIDGAPAFCTLIYRSVQTPPAISRSAALVVVLPGPNSNPNLT